MSKWGNLVIGQVIKRGVVRPDTVKVRCLKMKLDNNLNKYFNSRKHYWAEEGGIKTDIGDVILMERLRERVTPLVSHSIKEQVFKIGEVVDPVTGKRCRGKSFLDEELRQLEEEQIAEERAKNTSSSSSSS